LGCRLGIWGCRLGIYAVAGWAHGLQLGRVRTACLPWQVRAYRTNCKTTLVLNAVLGAFDPALISKNALAMCPASSSNTPNPNPNPNP